MRKAEDLKGQRFARLVVNERAGSTPDRSALWSCKCDCGNECTVAARHLKSGNTRSCGCLVSEHIRSLKKSITHGHSVKGALTTEYNIWRSMRTRCQNEKAVRYARYGGRGITVCEAWDKSFATFFHDMGRRPSKMHSLERRDNDKGYGPDNCYWATLDEQNSNKGTTRMVTVKGETLPLFQAVKRYATVKPGTVSSRMSHGWDPERAILSPPFTRWPLAT